MLDTTTTTILVNALRKNNKFHCVLAWFSYGNAYEIYNVNYPIKDFFICITIQEAGTYVTVKITTLTITFHGWVEESVPNEYTINHILVTH